MHAAYKFMLHIKEMREKKKKEPRNGKRKDFYPINLFYNPLDH